MRFAKALLLFFILPLSTLYSHPVARRLSYGRDFVYQPIIINGEVVRWSGHPWGHFTFDRYEAIKAALTQLDRPFTVLDLGANNGFFSLKIAEDFDAITVMVDLTDRLADICTLNTERNNIIYLKKAFNTADIKQLEQLEHFDVVLALHVLHHVDNWKEWLDTLFKLGDHVIIETPSENDPINHATRTKRLARYLTSLPQGIEIGSFDRGKGIGDHLLWFSSTKRSDLKRHRFGIKSSTFFLFNGRFPSPGYVNAIDARITKEHGSDKCILQGVDYSIE